MYMQCDVNGNEYLLLDAFVDNGKNGSALSEEDQKIVVKRWKALSKSTTGWDICCKWKDDSKLWEKLSSLNESHPMKVAEFAIAKGIQHEPALNWCIHHVLKKRDSTIFNVKW